MTKGQKQRKRGQVTIFILIGIILLFSVSATFYFNYEIIKDKLNIGKEKPRDFTATADAVKSAVEKCLKETAEEGLFYIGLQGGYYETNPHFEQLSDMQTPYYFYLGNESIPTKDTIQDELSKYIQEKLQGCIDLAPFENQGYSFETGEASATANIKEKQVNIDAEFPITIQRETVTSTIRSFNQEVSLDFYRMYAIVEELAKEQKKSPNSVPLIFLSDLAYRNGFKYATTDMGENSVLFTLFFNNTVKDDYYTYAFMAQYKEAEITIPEEPVTTTKYGEYRTKLYATTSEATTEVSSMSDTEFGDKIKSDSGSLQKKEVFDEFNSRIKTGGETGMISILNNNKDVKDAWFDKFNMICEECKLVSFDGKTAVTALGKVSFSPSELGGSTIFQNGTVMLDNGIMLSEGAAVTKVDKSYSVKGGKTNFISTKGYTPTRISKGKALISANDESQYYLEATSDKPLIVSIDEVYTSTTISGGDILISPIKDDGTHNEEEFLKFSGKMTFLIKGKHMIADGAELTEHKNGKPSLEYKFTKETDYCPKKDNCFLKYPRSCVERVGNELKILAKDNNNVQIKILDDSMAEFKHVVIRDRSVVTLNDKGLLELKFSKKDMPQITKGDPKMSSIHIQRIFNEFVTLDYRPTKGGYALDILVNENPVGAMMNREMITMNSMQNSLKNQKEWAAEIQSQLGGQSPHNIIAYFNNPEELPLIQSVYRAHDKSRLDPNFLSAVAFGEGLIFWMDYSYYESAGSTVDAFGEIGADRFGKEVNSYEQSLKASNIEIKGKKLIAEITEISEPGSTPQSIKPAKIEIDAEKVSKVDGKMILEVRGDIIEIEEGKLKIKTKGLVEKGYLSEDFDKDEEFKVTNVISSERGENIPAVTFNNLDSALEGMGAMLKMRRELFLDDVKKAGFNPRKLTEDQINYWTYVYYNGGSGAPEDLFGIGRKIVNDRLSKQGLKGLAIPSEQTESEIHSNAQRILGTKKLLDKANPSLARSARLALKE